MKQVELPWDFQIEKLVWTNLHYWKARFTHRRKKLNIKEKHSPNEIINQAFVLPIYNFKARLNDQNGTLAFHLYVKEELVLQDFSSS